MSILDGQLHVGAEEEFAVEATPTVSIETMSDSIVEQREALETLAYRANLMALRLDRTKLLPQGATGTIEAPLLSSGLELLLASAVGDYFFTPGATVDDANRHDFVAGGNASPVSLTAVIGRPDVNGVVRGFTYVGGSCTSFTITQGVNEVAALNLEMDFADELIADNPTMPTPAYPADAVQLHWTDCLVEIDLADGEGFVPLDTKSFQMTVGQNRDVDRRFLRQSHYKKRQVRKGVPEVEGEFSGEFEGMELYRAVKEGRIVKIRTTWNVDVGEQDDAQLIVELPAVQFRAEGPINSMDDLPEISLGFRALDAGETYNGIPALARVSVLNYTGELTLPGA